MLALKKKEAIILSQACCTREICFPSKVSYGSYLQWYANDVAVCLLLELCWNSTNSQCTYTFVRSGQNGRQRPNVSTSRI